MIIKIKIIFRTYHNREPLFVNLFVIFTAIIIFAEQSAMTLEAV